MGQCSGMTLSSDHNPWRGHGESGAAVILPRLVEKRSPPEPSGLLLVGAGRARTESARARVVPRVALTPAEAAESLGCSAEFFREHVDLELRWIRRGRKRFVPESVV